MACNGHTNSCPSHAGYIGPESPTAWTDDPLSNSVEIEKEHWNELRNAIDAETTRRSESWTSSEPTTRDEGGLVTNEYKILRDQLYYLGATTDSNIDDPNLNKGKEVEAIETTKLQDATNELEIECICNCNYSCTCNCNYCVCDCNYCTCNCAYPCTCDCNYGGGGK